MIGDNTDHQMSVADDDLDFTRWGRQGLADGCLADTALGPSPDEAGVLSAAAPATESQPLQTARVAEAGPLGDPEPDTMTLHTRDAYHLFTGRKHQPGSRQMPIPGGRKFAAALKAIWHLSAHDNPYADWMLIRLQAGLEDIRRRIGSATCERELMLDQIRDRGLALTVMRSRKPLVIPLGFRSPYGYATAQTMVEFDYCVRVIKTLVNKDQLSDLQGRDAIRALGRSMRSHFLAGVRLEHALYRDALVTVSRLDFLPGADAAASQRVATAAALFGALPSEILMGQAVPRHTRRRGMQSLAALRAAQATVGPATEMVEPAMEALL